MIRARARHQAVFATSGGSGRRLSPLRWLSPAASRPSCSLLDPIVRSTRRAQPTTSATASPTCSRWYGGPRNRSWIQIAEIPGVAAVGRPHRQTGVARYPELSEPATAAGYFTAGHRRAQAQPALHACRSYCRKPAGPRKSSSTRPSPRPMASSSVSLLRDPERPQARADDRRYRLVAGVHLHDRARRHHARRSPLRRSSGCPRRPWPAPTISRALSPRST